MLLYLRFVNLPSYDKGYFINVVLERLCVSPDFRDNNCCLLHPHTYGYQGTVIVITIVLTKQLVCFQENYPLSVVLRIKGRLPF